MRDSLTAPLGTVFRHLLLLGVGIIPLIGFFNGFGYEQIKVLFFITVVSIATVLWLILARLEPKKYELRWNHIKLASTLFILSLGLSTILGVEPLNSLLGQAPYYQGFIFYLYLFLFSLLVSVERIDLKLWAVAISISASLVAVIALKDFILLNIFHQSIATYAGRVVSTFGQPNFYAGYLLFSLPFVYLLFKNGKNLRKLSYICFGLVVSGTGASFSRSTIFILAALLVFLLLHKFIKSAKLLLGVGVIALIIGCVISVVVASGIFYEEVFRPLTFQKGEAHQFSIERRGYIWPVITQLIVERPIFGYGLENLSQAFSSYKPPEKLFGINIIGVNALIVDRSHNLIMDLLIFSGAVGLISFIYLLIQILHKTRHRAAFTFLVVYLIWMMFQNPSAVHLILFFLIVGLIDQKHSKVAIDKEFR